MRPTDEERREVAEKLRELPTDMYAEMSKWEEAGIFIESRYFDEAGYSQIHDILLGCFPADYMHPCDYEKLHNRLADLIEPEERTCRDDGAGVFRCTRCGAFVRRGSVMDCCGPIPIRFCPNCGAEVVE